jgi:palmitoyl-protein thioesterase
MQNIAKSVSSTYPGLYSIAVSVADGMSSYTTNIGKQVDEFAAAVRADPKLSKGFTAVGLSQGGLIVRVYAEVYNDPPVFTLVSMCGPQEGVGDCPGGTPEFLCNLVREDIYGAPVSFAGYWKDSMDQAGYLKKSKWLADWNNDQDSKNETYRENLLSLKKYVLVQALNDTVVKPHVSEDHGFFQWGSITEVNTFTETDEYAGDWLGLKTLSGKGLVDHYSYVGEHLRWSEEFWTTTIMPYFDATFSSFEAAMLATQ